MAGIFDKGIYWHVIASTLYQGGALVMGLAIIVRLLSPREWHVRGIDMRRANGVMVVLLAVWSLASGILAMLTGFFNTWGLAAVTAMSLTANKAMFSTFALVALVLMLSIRYRYGPALWDDPALKAAYAALGFVAAAVAVVNGSLGGEAGLIGTALDRLWAVVGIDPHYPMVLSRAGGIVLVALAVGATGALLAVRIARRRARP
jgi:hypothetical protein